MFPSTSIFKDAFTNSGKLVVLAPSVWTKCFNKVGFLYAEPSPYYSCFACFSLFSSCRLFLS